MRGRGLARGPALTVPALVAALWVTSAPGAAAQGLVNEGFRLDLIEIPIIAPGRMVSMGGAFAALAEGIDGASFNPAAVAARNPREHGHFEWELSPSLSTGASRNDLWNGGQGAPRVDTSFVLELGARMQFGAVGAGVAFQVQNYTTLIGDQSVGLTATGGRVDVGYEFADGAIIVGVGVRALRLALSAAPIDDPLAFEFLTFVGYGAELGALYRPPGRSYRLGAALRTPVNARISVEDSTSPGVSMVPRPSSADYPFELRLGAAYQFGPRRLNRRGFERKRIEQRIMRALRAEWCERDLAQVEFELRALRRQPPEGGLSCPRLTVQPVDPVYLRREEARRAEELEVAEEHIEELEDAFDAHLTGLADQEPREKYLLAASLIVYGRAGSNAIGLDAFFDQELRARRQGASFGLRAGFEMEPWANRLKTRGGFYLEPDRNPQLLPRVHATWGFDLRLFRWDLFGLVDPFDFQVSFYFDGAADYVTYGFGVGLWH